MPFNAYTDPDNFAVTGSMTIIADPTGVSGSSANLNVGGTVVASGTASFASGLTASSLNVVGAEVVSGSISGLSGVNLAGPMVVTSSASFASGVTISSASVGTIVGLTTISGPMTVSGGYTYDVVTGGLPAATTSSQSLSTGSQINMTSGVSVGGAHVVYVSANSSAATVALTPTSSANTSGVYQNGLEVTVINLAATGSTVVIPSVSGGPNAPLAVTISGGAGKKFVYIAALQSWIGL